MEKFYRLHIDEQNGIFPEWYWKKGIHDAVVTGVFKRKFEYNSTIRASNCVEIRLDASQAMFDTSVKIIRFYNCKVLTPGFDIAGMWWVKDRLTSEGDKYLLEIDLDSPKTQCRLLLRFDNCEVER